MTDNEFRRGLKLLQDMGSEGIFCVTPASTSFILERIARKPVPHTRPGVGIYASMSYDVYSKKVAMDIGPCIITANCSVNDAPYTTDDGVLWSYWSSYTTSEIGQPEIECYIVSQSDLLVKLRTIYPALYISSDRFAIWKKTVSPQLFGTATTYDNFQF
jgi:hypothetical protein